MKKMVIGVVIALAGVFIIRSCSQERNAKAKLKESTQLIQQQIDNVSKLIVTEGHFAEVYTYKDSQQLFGPLITADKKALVVVNAEVTLAYDLSKIEFRVEGDTKTLHIVSIPEPEIKIHPDFEYYDVSADYFNPFDASDYNAIKTKVRAILIQKIATSSLKSNAQNRLISELQKFYILTHSMGWSLVFQDQVINQEMDPLLLQDDAFGF